MFRKLNNAWIFFSLTAYFSVFISPAKFWLAGFWSLTIPFFIFGHIIWVFIWAFRRKKDILLNILMLFLSFFFLKSTFQVSQKSANIDVENKFSVLSYNVKAFNLYESKNLTEKNQPSKKMIAWVEKNSADIQCLQEFYHRSGDNIYNTVEQLSKNKHTLFHSLKKNSFQGTFGMAIISTFPMIRKGVVDIRSNTLNACVFADVLIRKDTVRIYNLHLQSMSIDEKEVVEYDKFKNKYYKIFLKLRKGFVRRALQIEFIKEHIKKSNVKKIILCGDFNELPYSYVYFSLNTFLENAFEKKGNGFGFTYNGQMGFLRIDNQFFTDNLMLHDFRTENEIRHSDHFPLFGEYSINE